MRSLVSYMFLYVCEGFRLRSCLEVVLDKHHWMLYYLVPAMYPRFMITLDEDLKNLPVTVRVGQVCDISIASLHHIC